MQLLDYEPRAADQVPLLISMEQDELALIKAIESGDTDLGKATPMNLCVYCHDSTGSPQVHVDNTTSRPSDQTILCCLCISLSRHLSPEAQAPAG